MDDLFLHVVKYRIYNNFFLVFFYRFFILSIFVSPKLDLKSESYDHYGNPSTCPSVFVGGMVKHDWFWRENSWLIASGLPFTKRFDPNQTVSCSWSILHDKQSVKLTLHEIL